MKRNDPPLRPRVFLAVVVGFLLFAVGVGGSGCTAETKPLPEGECGDGVLNKGEECDLGEMNSDILPDNCRTSCELPHCGDRVLDSDEVCDSSDLAGTTCLDLGYLEGRLQCSDECDFDVSECSTCGDDGVSGREECDGVNLDGKTCVELGFSSGTLLCDDDCHFDVSECVGGCGNGVKEEGEACDGDDLGGDTCAALGFAEGTLACDESCSYDRSECIGGCGNGVVEEGEDCDDGNDVDYDGCSSCRSSDGRFSPGHREKTCQLPQDLAATDVNGDGNPDLVVACAGDLDGGGSITVHLNEGDGTFGASGLYHVGVPVTAVAVGDVDGDGFSDVVASFLAAGTAAQDGGGVFVMKGNGDGTLDATLPSPAGKRPMDVALGDFTEDGVLDVALGDVGDQRVQILTGVGDGTFTLATFLYTYGTPNVLLTADVDLDGHTDILTVRQIYDIGVIYLGLGGGAFSSPISRLVGDRPTGVAVGHFNGDTYPDVVFSNAGDGVLSVLVGLGQGEFAYPGTLELEPGLSTVLAAPLDGDENTDLLVLGGATDTLWTLLGTGDGSFSSSFSVTTCDSPVDASLADFDGDGLWDVATACSFSDEVSVHLGHRALSP